MLLMLINSNVLKIINRIEKMVTMRCNNYSSSSKCKYIILTVFIQPQYKFSSLGLTFFNF